MSDVTEPETKQAPPTDEKDTGTAPSARPETTELADDDAELAFFANKEASRSDLDSAS